MPEPTTFIPSLIIFLIAYFFIATEKVDKTITAILGAALLICTHQIHYHAAAERIDLNVIFLLIGMMMCVNILASTGLFEWIAIVTAQVTKGDGPRLLILMLLVTAVLSAFLDNVTTIILIAPITILITQLLEIPTTPFLILEAIFSNIGGTGTLVGDPPNIIIGSKTHLTFNDFFINLGPIALIILLVLGLIVKFRLGNQFKVSEAAKSNLMQAEPQLAIIHPKRLKLALPCMGLVLLGFFLSHTIGVDTGIIALAGGFLMCLICKQDIHHALAKLEWSTIMFFIGLFMMVGALEENGLFEVLGNHVIDLTKGNLLITALAVLWFSALASAFLDNIPLVISFIPILNSIIPGFCETAGLDPNSAEALQTIAEPLYWSLALGACLGGNGTLIGASANVVVTQIARKNKYKLSFGDFFKLGFPTLLISVAISSLYIYLRYFRFVG
ncbi:ArsB/NhaD family transporter [Kiritimatiellota bacterium B12222]|nr:ArsB/NhaD family transporter [Kiritimatiellota bacterium B12222]